MEGGKKQPRKKTCGYYFDLFDKTIMRPLLIYKYDEAENIAQD
jgi:hypothetical protein